MELQEKSFCYNCFRELPGLPGGPGPGEMPGPGGIYAGGPCPYCGFDPEENAKKYPAALRAGTVLNNRYIVGRVLGQGGFGITYLAWDEKLAAKVAVKEYMPYEIAARIGTSVSVAMESRAEDFTYGRERFREEARTLAKFMGQPNIAGVTDYFDENDTSYFVMDYIEGISFKTYIANAGGKVSVQEALDVMIPVLRALTAVHAEGFIHRDVTPDNIYITKDGNVKLLDFGSARYSLGDKSKSLDVILKVGYAPKEQYIRRGRQGPYTDVYSCAACLYAAITGYLPPESLERLDHDGLVPPSQAGVEIPLYLERAILKGLAVQPEDRFQTAGEFLEALESRKVVELPGGDAWQADAGQKAGQPPTELEKKKKSLRIPIMGGIAAAAVAAAFLAGSLLGNGGGIRGTGTPGAEGIMAQGENLENPAEALAPKVTIAGEEYSTALTRLDLAEYSLTGEELKILGEMKDLKTLRLKKTSDLSDLSPLSSLQSLTSLDLEVDRLEDLSFLSGLENLEELRIFGPVVCEDLTAFSGLSKLRYFRADLMGLTSLKGAERMTALEEFDISDESQSSVSDLRPLSGLVHLKHLRVGTQGLAGLQGLEQLTELEELYLGGSEAVYTDLQPLKNLSKLRVLDLPMRSGACPAAYSGAGLEGLKSLKEAELDRCIESLEPLRNLTNLQSLYVRSGSTIKAPTFQSLEPLSGLVNLEHLGIIINNPEEPVDIAPLAGMTKLSTLQLLAANNGRSQLANFSALANLTSLTSLELQVDNLPDISPLAGLSNLTSVTLKVWGEKPKDMTPLAHVPAVSLTD